VLLSTAGMWHAVWKHVSAHCGQCTEAVGVGCGMANQHRIVEEGWVNAMGVGWGQGWGGVCVVWGSGGGGGGWVA